MVQLKPPTLPLPENPPLGSVPRLPSLLGTASPTRRTSGVRGAKFNGTELFLVFRAKSSTTPPRTLVDAADSLCRKRVPMVIAPRLRVPWICVLLALCPREPTGPLAPVRPLKGLAWPEHTGPCWAPADLDPQFLAGVVIEHLILVYGLAAPRGFVLFPWYLTVRSFATTNSVCNGGTDSGPRLISSRPGGPAAAQFLGQGDDRGGKQQPGAE